MKKLFLALTLAISLMIAPFAMADTGYIPDPSVGIPPTEAQQGEVFAYPDARSLAKYVIAIRDQKTEPWCVAYCVTGAVEAQMRSRGLQVPTGGFSAAWLYARCKQLDGIPNTPGTYIRTAMSIARNEGLCPESLCPTEQYNGTGKLPVLTQEMQAAAAKYKITSYTMLKDDTGYANIEASREAIANGHFVIMGTLVEQSWNAENGGYLLDPYGYIRGGHCVFWDNYNINQAYANYTNFIGGANSWGPQWGLKGRFLMADNYVSWRDLSLGMPMILETWAMEVTGIPVTVEYIDMPIPLQVINPGYTVMPFRVVFEALGGTVDWGYNAEGKIWVKGTVELKTETVTLEMTEGDPVLKVTHS